MSDKVYVSTIGKIHQLLSREGWFYCPKNDPLEKRRLCSINPLCDMGETHGYDLFKTPNNTVGIFYWTHCPCQTSNRLALAETSRPYLEEWANILRNNGAECEIIESKKGNLYIETHITPDHVLDDIKNQAEPVRKEVIIIHRPGDIPANE